MLIQVKFLPPVGVLDQRLLVDFVQHTVAQHERIKLRAHETAIGLLWRTDNRLATDVEGRVDQHATARFGFKRFEQVVVAGVRLRVDRLNPGRIIDVRHCRDVRARHVEQIDPPQGLLFLGHGCAPRLDDGSHQQHVRTVGVHRKIIGHSLPQDRGGKGSKGLAVLDFEVHHRLHLGTPGIAQDAPGAEGARPKLHAPLEPANDLLCQFLGNAVIQLRIAQTHIRRIFGLEKLLNLGVAKGWPQEGALHPIPPAGWARRGCSSNWCQAASAAPTAPPASPAAG